MKGRSRSQGHAIADAESNGRPLRAHRVHVTGRAEPAARERALAPETRARLDLTPKSLANQLARSSQERW